MTRSAPSLKNTIHSSGIKLKAQVTLAAALFPQVLSGSSFVPFVSLASVSCAAMATSRAVGAEQTNPAPRVPLGARQAWNVDVTYTVDAGKLAREQGGEVYLFKLVPPRMSNGTSQNQEIIATLTAQDGSTATVKTTEEGDELLVLKVGPKSGTAQFRMTGIVYNRVMTNIANGGVELSKEDQEKYTSAYRHSDVKSPAVKSALQKLGLVRGEQEADSAFVQRVSVWLATNKTYKVTSNSGDTNFDNPADILTVPYYTCNSASACLALILRANGIPTKVNPRAILRFDRSWTFHSDISAYIRLEKKWMGISGAGLLGGGKDELARKGSLFSSMDYGQDVAPRYRAVLVDMANDVGHSINLPGFQSIFLKFNEQSIYWTNQNSCGKATFTITHKISAIEGVAASH